jgi:protein phosphatase
VNSAAKTDTGCKRKNNEDYVLYYEPGNFQQIQSSGFLYIVADGVGGEARGEFASKFSTHKVLYEYYSQVNERIAERLHGAMLRADQEIKAFVQKHTLSRMATTMVAAVLRGSKLTLANVGDSRAYLVRDKQIKQITRDHNLVGEMLKSGLISSEEEAIASDVKNRLLRSIGGHSEMKPEFFEETVQVGDRIMLCSDGFTRYATSELTLQMVLNGSPQQAVDQMVEYARQQGGADNITVIIFEIQGPMDTSRTQQPRGAPPEPVTLAELMGAAVAAPKPESPYPGQEVIASQAETLHAASTAETMAAPSTTGQTVELPPSKPSDETMQVVAPAREHTVTPGAVQPMQSQFADPATIQWDSRSLQAGREEKKDFPVWIIPAAIVGGIMLIVMIFVGFRIFNNFIGKEEATSTPTVTEEMSAAMVETDTAIPPTPAPTMTMVPPSPTPEPPTPIPPTDTPVPTPTERVPPECLSTPIPEYGLSQLLENFSKPYIANRTYYYRICDFNETPPCGERFPIPPGEHEPIQSEWWIIIPGIRNMEACGIPGGTWLEFPPSPGD